MPRTRASVPPEAIRIEDEVWQDAFARREPARPRPERRLRAIDGGRTTTAPARPRTSADPAERPDAPPVSAPRRERPPTTDSRPERRHATAPRTAAARHSGSASPGSAAGDLPGRRTVTIRGHGAERNLPWPDGSSRRPQRRVHERAGFKPDRVAMWAVMLGILLVIVAIASSHG